MASNVKAGRLTALALFAASFLMSTDCATAQPTQAQQNALRSNCRSDFMANCSSVKPGGAEALQCLQRNVAKLSPGCQSAVNALTPQRAPAQAAPAPAAAPAAPPPAAAAAPTPPAPPAAPAPAKTTAAPPPAAPAHQTARPPKASPAAAPAAAPRQPTAQQQAAIKQSCQSDFMARCRGVSPGGAQALQCLQRNSAQLSPNCRNAVAALGGSGAPAAATASAPAAAAPAAAPTAQQQNAIKFTCRRDFGVHCRGVPQGGPEALACLQRNAARLSPDCRTSIAAIADEQAATVAPAAAPAASAPPPGRPVGPLRRAIRDKMMSQ